MKENQRILMKNLLSYLYNYNPYYNRIMREICVNPMTDDIELVYSALPYSTKEMWLENMDDMLKLADQLGFNREQFLKDFNSKETSDEIDSELKKTNELGLDATPTMFINGEKIVGVKPYYEFKEILIKHGAKHK